MYYGCHRTFLLLATAHSLVNLTGSEVSLDVKDELGNRTFALGGRKSNPTLNGEYDNREEQRDKNRHDDTALIHSTHIVQGVTVGGVVVGEVGGVAHDEHKQANGQSGAHENNDKGASDALNVGSLFLFLGSRSCRSCGLGSFSFHKMLRISCLLI